MFIKNLGLILVTIFCLNSNAKDLTKNEIIKKLGLKIGSYDVVVPAKNKADFCTSENLDIELIDSDKNITLVIGSRLSYPHVETSEYTDSSDPSCSLKIENKLTAGKLVQTTEDSCDKASKRIHEFIFKNNMINYTLVRGSKKVMCNYKYSKKG